VLNDNDDDEEEQATTSGDEIPVEKGGAKEPLHSELSTTNAAKTSESNRS